MTYSYAGFTRDKHNFYDAEAIHESFGEDAEGDVLESTKGLGPGWVEGGEHYHVDRKTKEPVRTTDKEMDLIYLGGANAEES